MTIPSPHTHTHTQRQYRFFVYLSKDTQLKRSVTTESRGKCNVFLCNFFLSPCSPRGALLREALFSQVVSVRDEKEPQFLLHHSLLILRLTSLLWGKCKLTGVYNYLKKWLLVVGSVRSDERIQGRKKQRQRWKLRNMKI